MHEYKTTRLNGRLITHLPRNLPPRTSRLRQVCRFHPISSLAMKKAVITVWNLLRRQLQSNGIGVWKHALLLTIGYIPIILIPLQGFRLEGTGGGMTDTRPFGDGFNAASVALVRWWRSESSSNAERITVVIKNPQRVFTTHSLVLSTVTYSWVNPATIYYCPALEPSWISPWQWHASMFEHDFLKKCDCGLKWFILHLWYTAGFRFN